MAGEDVHRKGLQLRLFGMMQARLWGEPLSPLRSRKGEWLLALLALRGAAVSRSWLAGTLWPDSDESRALLYLRRELTYLRKALGAESHLIGSSGRSLKLDLANVDCDVARFDEAISRADSSSLEVAVAVYVGPLLEGCDEAWVLHERESREQSQLAALEQLAESDLVRGDIHAAIGRLRLAVSLDPLRESARRALMKALADSGEAAAAVQVYRDLRIGLRRDLNTDVDPETTALFHRIRGGARRRADPQPAAPRASAEMRINRVPIPLSALIGREQELGDLRRRLSRTRLLTLTGTGGVGKTRLSIELAEEAREDFADGACFVELAALRDPALLPQAALDAFGWKPDPRLSAEDVLLSRLISTDILLVLDNCEHLLEPCADLAAALLSACSHLRILATSREPLGIAGETVWRVPPLSIPPHLEPYERRDKHLAADLMEYEAVVLFVERARQANADFRLTAHNAEAVSKVCLRLDGVPLALEMAAARLRSLTIEDVDSNLDQRFRLLNRGSRTALPRHRTLRSLIDWSYDLLSDPEKALLCRLSVFRGGWTLESAQDVCSGHPVEREEVLELLSSLADKSLVVADTQGRSVRYRLLETIREYALDRLDAMEDSDRWRNRHLTYFVELAETAEPQLTRSEQQQWLERLETEHDNIRAALERSWERRDSINAGLRLAGAVSRFWTLRGHNREGRDWSVRLLEAEPGKHDPLVRAKALNGAAIMASDQGDASAADMLVEEELAIRRALEDRRGIANAMNVQANIAFLRGDYEAERAIRYSALAIWRELGDRWGIAVSLGNLGGAASAQSDYITARELLEESLAIRRELGVRRGIAHSLYHLGIVVHTLGEHESAREMYEKSIAIERDLGNWRGVANVLCWLAKLQFDDGNTSMAWSYLRESIGIHQELNDRLEIVFCLELAATYIASAGACHRAARIWGTADRIREEAGSPRSPNELASHRQQVADARITLGGDAAFERAWQQGRAMTLEQAVRLALSDD